MADVEILDVQVGTIASLPTVTDVPPDAVLLWLYMQKSPASEPWSRELNAVSGLGATWTVKYLYSFYAMAVGVNPTVTSGTPTPTLSAADPLAGDATVVLWVLRGVVDPQRLRFDADNVFSVDDYELGHPTIAAAPGMFVGAVINRDVWSEAHALEFPSADASRPVDAEWSRPPGVPGVVWMDSTQNLDPFGEVVRVEANWTPQPGDKSQVLSGVTRYHVSAIIITLGEPSPLPEQPLEWPSDPIFVEGYHPTVYASASGARLVWANEEKTKAIVAWLFEQWDSGYDYVEIGAVRACVISIEGGAITAGPVLSMSIPAGHAFLNYNTDIVPIGDGYFVAGSGSYLANPYPTPDGPDKFHLHLLKIDADGTTLVDVSRVEMASVNLTYQPFFAPTANPNRVLVAGLVNSNIRLWTLTRSGESLTFVDLGSMGGSGDPCLWVSKDRSIGYVGPMELDQNSTTTGSIFTLSPDGIPTVTATGIFDHAVHRQTQGFLASGPGDKQMVGSDNFTDLPFSCFDIITTEVTETGMSIAERRGPYFGDEGWNGSYTRWIPRTVTPDGRVVILPSVADQVYDHQRPYLVLDVNGEPVKSDFLPTDRGWEPYADSAYYWGMDVVANDQGALVAVVAEQYPEASDDNSGSPGVAVAFALFGPPVEPLPVYPPTSAVVPGPEGTEPWAAPHHGRFKIADFGERKGRVSFGAKMSADGPYHVEVYARWSYWNEETEQFTSAGPDTLVYGPSVIGDEGGEFGYVSEVFFGDVVAPQGASHWQPVIRWYSRRPTASDKSGLVPGSRVRIDNFYIPDNGYPIDRRPYLDGDQPDAMWEGPRAASTSVYGDPTVLRLERLVTLEEEFLIPDADESAEPALTIHLDDDLKI